MSHLKKFSVSVFIVLCFVCGAAEGGALKSGQIPDFRLPAKTFFAIDNTVVNGRAVFAWYMLCCGPFNGGWEAPVEEYKRQIQMAQSMGIDGFGLDVMRPDDMYSSSIDKMFRAARELDSGFKLFFKFDYGKGDSNQISGHILSMMQKYGSDEHYFSVGGKPLVSYYGLDCHVEDNPELSLKWWRDEVMPLFQANNVDIYFVPETFEQARKGGGRDAVNQVTEKWSGVSQGMSLWQIQTSPIGGGLQTLERQAEALHKLGKTWMSTVSYHYWWGSSKSVPTSWLWMPDDPTKQNVKNGKYFEHAGGKGIEMQWKSIIETQKPQWVMILTWNDYNESYIEPIDDYKKYPNGTTNAPLGWYKSMRGFCELSRYYIQWYKTGLKPEISADSIFYSYRTHSQNIQATIDRREPVQIGNGPIGDDLYITLALTAPATFRVSSGNTIREMDVDAGIQQIIVPFLAGKQIFSVYRGGALVVTTEGEPVVSSTDYYRYWPTTGFATALTK